MFRREGQRSAPHQDSGTHTPGVPPDEVRPLGERDPQSQGPQHVGISRYFPTGLEPGTGVDALLSPSSCGIAGFLHRADLRPDRDLRGPLSPAGRRRIARTRRCRARLLEVDLDRRAAGPSPWSMFIWGATLFFHIYDHAPGDAVEVYVVGKQWMWHAAAFRGTAGDQRAARPVGRPVKLTMTSQDVIHSFFVPAFRVKQDVLPGRYTTMWFEPTKVGRYHLFCAEYCGTNHSAMGGWVDVMEPADFEQWLSRGGDGPVDGRAGRTPVRPVPLRRLPPRQPDRPCPAARGRLRAAGPDPGGQRRPVHPGRRALHPRLDPAAQDRRSWPDTSR